MLLDIEKKKTVKTTDNLLGLVSFDWHLNEWRSTKEINEGIPLGVPVKPFRERINSSCKSHRE